MPSKTTVFDKKCNPLLELGTGPYNTIRWNPKGKCILQNCLFHLENIYFVNLKWLIHIPFDYTTCLYYL